VLLNNAAKNFDISATSLKVLYIIILMIQIIFKSVFTAKVL